MLKVLFLPPTLGSSEPAPSAFSALGLGYMSQVSAWGNSFSHSTVSVRPEWPRIHCPPFSASGAELQTFATRPHWPDQFGKIHSPEVDCEVHTEFCVVCFGFLFF